MGCNHGGKYVEKDSIGIGPMEPGIGWYFQPNTCTEKVLAVCLFRGLFTLSKSRVHLHAIPPLRKYQLSDSTTEAAVAVNTETEALL
jgi:hypothetical protein